LKHSGLTQPHPRPLKVLHLIETLGSGGAERLLYTNLKNLDARHFQSCVVTLFAEGTHFREAIRELGVETIALECRSRRDVVRGIVRLGDQIRIRKPDLIHTHLLSANLVGRVAGRFHGIPVISTIHNPDYEPHAFFTGARATRAKQLFARELDRWTARWCCSHLIAVSKYVQASVARHLRFEPITVIYNPVDLDALEGPHRGREQLLQEIGLPPDAKILLNVGRVSPQKGLIDGIRALPAVLRAFPDAHLLTVGATGDSGWVKTVLDAAIELGVREHVHLLGSRRDIGDLLRACDLFVFPSMFEGMGIALIEAMAMGCACIATATGPIPEIISDGVDGFLVPPQDTSRLASAICESLAHPERAREVGRAAAESARRRFQAAPAAEQLAVIYRSVTNTQ
jgi:glycosyltransferase involved in cell wall biosynthesis